MAVADDALAPIQGLEIDMCTKKVRDLRLDRLGKQGTRATAQHFGQLIAEGAWLNQFDDVRIRQGILPGIPQMAPELGWILAFYGAFSKTEVRSGRLPSTRAARTVVEGLI